MYLQPIILSGGSGTRLWPLSREHFPKQLLSLVGEHTMIQDTILRICSLENVLSPVIVCNKEHRFLVAEQMRQIDITPQQLILEPSGRNTAPALTLAALSVLDKREDCILLVMPADHVIRDIESFHQCITLGHQLAEKNHPVAFGVAPTHPESGYGYIEVGESITENAILPTAFKLQSFKEKPDRQTAQFYLETKRYLWNSGMFMFKASIWIEKISTYTPKVLQACTQAIDKGTQDGDFFRVESVAFSSCPSDSIDYAVMEKLTDQEDSTFFPVVISLEAGWSDVGAWPSLLEASTRDEQGNLAKGDIYLDSTQNSLIFAENRMVAAIGLKDTMVVETSDVVLVVHKDYAQNVKNIVAQLKKENREEYISHRKVYRPWGYYESIDFGSRFQVKRIMVNPNASLSLQMHHHRAEHWIVVSGTARVIRDNEVALLSENQSTYIPLGIKHRLENPGKVPLEIIEVQSGSYLGEDDIVRFEDHYGRTK
ncbi:mannose-1-phosphate guanylyltransferase/mannose-6-phosphate isomerase [Candidatus Nitrosacidococcus tergens]|uniref:mannose-1-phosphate guanylyltransferase n=1 Tax=Candidatus Nitrosacidococcus tergens TaxID=553981 RepID=A0A7G1QBC3_9GAMM|nr:mannose-1-phosphate guanylyltransferase/mannose-6-phosphate isomerase [Candidatus Nitrosacidococcus tergens]CAB1276613.1 Mannose-1-phosphate guanylyltransferase/mannose-6-phosphate isomerase [Candidatus Nitrosacidococcus tergens]